MRKQLIWLMAAVICVSAFAIYYHEQKSERMLQPNENQSIGKTAQQPHRYEAPDFSLNTLDGRKISLRDFRGRYVLLNMWASWCGPCQAEAPELVRLHKKFASQGLSVIAVNMTSQELSLRHVKQFVRKFGIDFPVLLDTKGKVMNLYGVRGLPTSFLIGKNGAILRQFRGPLTVQDIAKVIGK